MLIPASDATHQHSVSTCQIQSDPIIRFPKKCEYFIFFNILDKAAFQKALPDFIDKVTCVTRGKAIRAEIKLKRKKDGLVPVQLVNIAFSKHGFEKLGLDPKSVGDREFETGQYEDAQNLGDPGESIDGKFKPKWDKHFTAPIDGIIVAAAESDDTLESLYKELVDEQKGIFPDKKTIDVVYKLRGNVRENHTHDEHFGWRDGVSQPTIIGLSDDPPVHQREVPPEVILVRRGQGDDRPAWVENGSFLVYRELDQLVPEFNDFIERNPIEAEGITDREHGSKLRAAQFFGRWKSGVPLELRPTNDDPTMKPEEFNNFRFMGNDQSKCPYSAHIRKTNPRDPEGVGADHLIKTSIVRAGITYGDEVSTEEEETKKTQKKRGLAFVCYQSHISQGFKMHQRNWANNPSFPPGNHPAQLDPIIGQIHGKDRTTADTQGNKLEGIPDFVVPRGGGYFFVPSIPALNTVFLSAPSV